MMLEEFLWLRKRGRKGVKGRGKGGKKGGERENSLFFFLVPFTLVHSFFLFDAPWFHGGLGGLALGSGGDPGSWIPLFAAAHRPSPPFFKSLLRITLLFFSSCVCGADWQPTGLKERD
jgi:hypothetical protein